MSLIPQTKIPVLYNPAMVADSGSFSPSASKACAVIAEWTSLCLPIDIRQSGAVSNATIKRAHSARYVDDVMALRRENGFGTFSAEVAAALPYQSGSLVDACMLVLAMSPGAIAPMACSPSSGFHHAHYGSAGGYCTFNGLVISALAVIDLGLAQRVAIIDCDYHYGDGTADILTRLKLGDKVRHYSAGGWARKLGDASRYQSELSENLRRLLAWKPDLFIYQAGADPHVDDPLGGLLTTEQMRQRDKLVFRFADTYGIPLVWCLAGGYQRDEAGTIQPVLDLHTATMRECIAVKLEHAS